jgi:pimeloyl-ACP methyl ester carboxylesterase
MKTLTTLLICLSLLIFNLSKAQNAISVKTQGNGKTLLFLPGFANSSDVWANTIEHIEGEYQFHLVDYAGFNGLQPVEMPWLPKVKADLVKYIKTNQLSEITIIGHSLGGTLALYLAGELPEHVKKIIVVDGLPNTAGLMFPSQKSGTFSYDNPYAKSQLSMPDENFREMITQQVKMMCKNSDKHNLITQWILNTDRKTYVQGYIDYLNFDATPYLKNITAEAYIISATSYGRAQTEKVYLSQYQNLENYDIRYAENSAHYIMFDQPQWFYKQLNDILNHE